MTAKTYRLSQQTSSFFSRANISINNEYNPINLGAKLKLLISSLQKCPWIRDLDLNCPRYARITEPRVSKKSVALAKSHNFRDQVDIFKLHFLRSIRSKKENFSAYWKANDKRILKQPQLLILVSFWREFQLIKTSKHRRRVLPW